MNRRGRSVLWLSLILFASLPPDAGAERLPIKTYTTADGLAHNDIRRIVKDSRGFLWFCTADGLSRFDGYGFTNYGVAQGLPHPRVNDLVETRRGEYLVATEGGLVRFEPKANPMFVAVVPGDGDTPVRGITVLREARDGTIWAGTNEGLYRLEAVAGGRALRRVEIGLPQDNPEQRVITDVLEDRRGSLWITAPSGLYRRWPDGSSAHYTMRDGLPHDYLSDLLEDQTGGLWAGTRLLGLFRFSSDGTHAPPVVDFILDQRDGLATGWIFQLFQASDGRSWAATARGLVEFRLPADPDGRRFRTYSERNGLSYFDITALNEDLAGNLWLGTNTAGAMKLTRGGFSTFGEQDGIETVNAVFEDRAGGLCFRGNVLGDEHTSVFEGARLPPPDSHHTALHPRLGCFDGRRFDWFKPRAVNNFGWVPEGVTLQARNGEWWAGTGEGLYRFRESDSFAQLKTAEPLDHFTTKDGLAAAQIFRLFQDSRDDIWISTTSSSTSGLARWESASQRIRDLSAAVGLPSLRNDVPRSFAEDGSGNVWIGFNSGLARYSQGRFTWFAETQGLPAGAIKDIHVDASGRIWLASARGGLIRVDAGNSERPVFVPYTTTQGLSSNNTEVIAEDRDGYLYIGGGHGLDRLDPASGRVKHFTTADGLTPGLFRAAFRDRKGVLWFGMTRGLARLAPVTEKTKTAPPVWVSGLRIRGVPELISALGERQLSLDDLAPQQNQLQIDFVGLSFASGEVLRYQYRLDGTDADWGALSEQRSVTFASLPAGRYAFLVRAVNSDGMVSPEPATVRFAIRSPFWQQAWFVTLVALAVALMAYVVYRYRLARLLEIANMRTRIATDLHDDIGANLTRIALLSEVASRGSDDEGPLASIARIARESVSSMSDIVWAINPKRDGLIDLTRRMRQHADEIFTQRGIELRFAAPAAHDSPKLGVDVRRDLLLIFKEAVNNAARHSHCSVIDIELKVDGSRLVLTVADNGEGFDRSIDSEGQGMTSMQRRAHRLKGTIDIASVKGVGTTVTVSIPI